MKALIDELGRVQYLANATMRGQIEAACRAAGYQPPIICTPEELLEVASDD